MLGFAAITIPLSLIEKIRKMGFIHEGYCPSCDAYECRLVVGPFQKVLTKTSFTHLGKLGLSHVGKATVDRKITERAARSREDRRIILARPGVFLVFKDILDLQQRIHEIVSHPGYAQAAHVAWFVNNKGSGVFSYMPADRFEYARTSAGIATAEELRAKLAALRRRSANKAKAEMQGPPAPVPPVETVDTPPDLPAPEVLASAA